MIMPCSAVVTSIVLSQCQYLVWCARLVDNSLYGSTMGNGGRNCIALKFDAEFQVFFWRVMMHRVILSTLYEKSKLAKVVDFCISR